MGKKHHERFHRLMQKGKREEANKHRIEELFHIAPIYSFNCGDEICIKPGKKFEIPIQVCKDSALRYSCSIKEHNINFSIQLKTHTGSVATLFEDRVAGSVTGSVLFEYDGVAYLSWSNEFSWLNEKHIKIDHVDLATLDLRKGDCDLSEIEAFGSKAEKEIHLNSLKNEAKAATAVITRLDTSVRNLKSEIQLLERKLASAEAEKASLGRKQVTLQSDINHAEIGVKIAMKQCISPRIRGLLLSYLSPTDCLNVLIANPSFRSATVPTKLWEEMYIAHEKQTGNVHPERDTLIRSTGFKELVLQVLSFVPIGDATSIYGLPSSTNVKSEPKSNQYVAERVKESESDNGEEDADDIKQHENTIKTRVDGDEEEGELESKEDDDDEVEKQKEKEDIIVKSPSVCQTTSLSMGVLPVQPIPSEDIPDLIEELHGFPRK
eukprot:TRINITY_DN11918_c0_g1_i1.p1 TRINITY_DN11918_c0_g1~~TRINITY_DN11918_c0_g1_i1.p1  ORF type:complete len:436 (-),score=112.25 TRINITY_DN11918_c0_g1_i1:265-1572(-)